MLIARLQPKQAKHTKTKKMEDAQNKTKQNKRAKQNINYQVLEKKKRNATKRCNIQTATQRQQPGRGVEGRQTQQSVQHLRTPHACLSYYK